MLLKEMNMRTIAIYNEMISYYHTHMGKVSKYGNMRITEKMLFNLVNRRAELSKRYQDKWVK